MEDKKGNEAACHLRLNETFFKCEKIEQKIYFKRVKFLESEQCFFGYCKINNDFKLDNDFILKIEHLIRISKLINILEKEFDFEFNRVVLKSIDHYALFGGFPFYVDEDLFVYTDWRIKINPKLVEWGVYRYLEKTIIAKNNNDFYYWQTIGAGFLDEKIIFLYECIKKARSGYSIDTLEEQEKDLKKMILLIELKYKLQEKQDIYRVLDLQNVSVQINQNISVENAQVKKQDNIIQKSTSVLFNNEVFEDLDTQKNKNKITQAVQAVHDELLREQEEEILELSNISKIVVEDILTESKNQDAELLQREGPLLIVNNSSTSDSSTSEAKEDRKRKCCCNCM